MAKPPQVTPPPRSTLPESEQPDRAMLAAMLAAEEAQAAVDAASLEESKTLGDLTVVGPPAPPTLNDEVAELVVPVGREPIRLTSHDAIRMDF